MPTNLIALTGQKSSGKTTLTKQLIAHNWQPTSFSTPIKMMLEQLFIYQDIDFELIGKMLHGDLKEKPTPYLNNQSPRHAMQTLGTEWRDLIHRDLWFDIWQRSIDLKTQKIIVDDCRFIHEANRIKSLGGIIIQINRPDNRKLDAHISEWEYLNIIPDLTIINDSTPQHMLDQVLTYLKEPNP